MHRQANIPCIFITHIFCTLPFSFNDISRRSLHISTWRTVLIFLTVVCHSIILRHLTLFWPLAFTKNFSMKNLEHVILHIQPFTLIQQTFIATYYVLGSNPGARERVVNKMNQSPCLCCYACVSGSATYIPRGAITESKCLCICKCW